MQENGSFFLYTRVKGEPGVDRDKRRDEFELVLFSFVKRINVEERCEQERPRLRLELQGERQKHRNRIYG